MIRNSSLSLVAGALFSIPCIGVAQDSKPATPQPATPPAAAAAPLDLAEVQKKIYDPTVAGLRDVSFSFVHPAFAITPAFSKMSFRCVWKADSEPRIEPVDLAPEYEPMKAQFTQIFDYVWRFAGPQTILREKAERAEKSADGVTVRLVAKDARHAWALQFKDVGGQLLLAGATSPEYGTVTVEYADVAGFHLVSRLTIDDPKRPIGKFTIECRDVKAGK
ncbi:MAG: hypothetical protein HYR85_13775 [Planctomycetes bacterium]|nr:hypothetical protein [Planctomycetota bacterium]MBI3845081.1 hypothetical protein [Planctomycetota bacterium]